MTTSTDHEHANVLPTASDFIATFKDGAEEVAEAEYLDQLECAERMLHPSLEGAREAMRNDDFLDAPGPSLHLHGDVADALLIARGWAVTPEPGGWKFTAPDGRFYWHREEALTLALTAEGLAAVGR